VIVSQRPNRDEPRVVGLDALRANASFDALPHALLAQWLSACAVWSVPRGQVLAEQGTVPDVCFGLVQGAAELGLRNATGGYALWDLVEPGQWLCVEPLLLNAPLPLRVRTFAPSVFLVMRRSVLRDLQGRHPAVSQALLDLGWRFSARLLRQSQLREGALRLRLRNTLSSLAERFGVRDGAWTRIGVTVSQADLAAMVGCTRQRVNLELQKLLRAGELRQQDRRYAVPVASTHAAAAGAG
jgi:CRP/FNR family transcriptional regulator, cyclic AMP receptor protein